MRRSVQLIGIAVTSLVLGVAPAAQAANPERVPFGDSGTDIDKDFCGTGKTVYITYFFQGAEFLSPNGKFEYANISHSVTTLTYGDVTLVNRSAGRFADVIVSGDPEGIHTHAGTNLGLPELWKYQSGGVLILDAGSITFLDTFNGDEFISGEVVFNGPHPEAASDFQLFCEVIPGALGIV